MKKITPTLVMITIAISVIAQSPQAFKYQTVVCDNAGEILGNQDVSFQISLLEGSTTGTAVYVETHDTITNEQGLVSLEIGNGDAVLGVFEDINWGGDSYFLQVELDETGGDNYQLMGTSQLLSVPYSLYSESTGDTSRWRKNNNKLYYNEGNVGIGISNPLAKLSVDGSGYYKGNGYFVNHDTSEVFIDLYNITSDWLIVAAADTNRLDIRVWGGDTVMSAMANGNVGIGTITPEESALLELNSESKGFLAPRLSTDQIINMENPSEGLMVYNTDYKAINIFDGLNWYSLLRGECIPQPTEANAGSDQANVCGNATLAANIPQVGTGNWSIISGVGCSFADTTNPATEFTGIPGNDYILAWTISNTCGNSTDEVNIGFESLGTIADAGPDQVDVYSPTILEGNEPILGSGEWTIISGTGGVLTSPYNPTTYFSGMIDSTYTLRWTISYSCNSNYDDVNISFIAFPGCPSTITDIDANSYNIVQIGNQCWMSENLKTTTYQNGTPIQNVTDNTLWNDLYLSYTGAYVWYNNDIGWKEEYGALYNWFAVVDANGLCPAGWHVPSYDEWGKMLNFINFQSGNGGIMLKSCRMDNSPLGGDCSTDIHPRWEYDDTAYGTDDYGFSGLPGGERTIGGYFGQIVGFKGSWWSASVSPTYTLAYSFWTTYNQSNIFYDHSEMQFGYSVRCIKD